MKYTINKYNCLIIIYSLLVLIVVSSILPADDDFFEGAAPYINDGSWCRLYPTVTFWRPIEKIIGYFLGEFPSLYPGLNHFIVIVGHICVCNLLFSGVRKWTNNLNIAMIATVYFMCSPGIIATLCSIDGINQCWALLCGLFATKYYFQYMDSSSVLKYCLYVIMAVMSVLFKENGIVWFIVPVMIFSIWSHYKMQKNIKEILNLNVNKFFMGLLFCIIYFSVRFYLMGEIALGDSDGRYSLTPTIKDVIMSIVLILGASFTSIDSVAFFLQPMNKYFIITSIVTTIMMLYIYGKMIKSIIIFQKDKRVMILLFFISFFISSPMLLMRVAEMGVYQMVFCTAFIIGIMIYYSKGVIKNYRSILMIILCGLLLTSSHKIYCMYEYGVFVNNYINENIDKFYNKPEHVLVYYSVDTPMGYSVYYQPVGEGIARGKAFRSKWNWIDSNKIKVVKIDTGVLEKIDIANESAYDTIFTLTSSGKIQILKN